MILFHILGLKDDKTVVKPRKEKRGKGFAVFLGSFENILHIFFKKMHIRQDTFHRLVTGL